MTPLGMFKTDAVRDAEAVEEEDRVFFLPSKATVDAGVETSLFKNKC